jgi:MFS superfamily sulfate permease-like transporter
VIATLIVLAPLLSDLPKAVLAAIIIDAETGLIVRPGT